LSYPISSIIDYINSTDQLICSNFNVDPILPNHLVSITIIDPIIFFHS